MQKHGLQLSGLAKNSNYISDYSLIFCNSLLAKIIKVQLLNIILIQLGKNCIQILFQHTATLILQPQN